VSLLRNVDISKSVVAVTEGTTGRTPRIHFDAFGGLNEPEKITGSLTETIGDKRDEAIVENDRHGNV
jgi:hypothetical protein